MLGVCRRFSEGFVIGVIGSKQQMYWSFYSDYFCFFFFNLLSLTTNLSTRLSFLSERWIEERRGSPSSLGLLTYSLMLFRLFVLLEKNTFNFECISDDSTWTARWGEKNVGELFTIFNLTPGIISFHFNARDWNVLFYICI